MSAALPFALAAQEVRPHRADRRGVEVPLFPQPAFVQQRLGPLAQRTAQPVADRGAEAGLAAGMHAEDLEEFLCVGRGEDRRDPFRNQ